MNIEEPEGEWTIKIYFSSKNCPYRFYPANETGCRIRNNEDNYVCSHENCPFVVTEES